MRDRGLLDVGIPIIHLKPVPYWRRRLEACLETHGDIGWMAALRQICNLQTLLTEILGHAGKVSQASGKPLWLEHACDALGDGSRGPINMPELAQSLGISFETFRKTFTQIMGLSPGRYHAARIMDRACELMLENRRLSGKQIAEHLGFSDEYHFSKRFKQITGPSPTDFRRQICLSRLEKLS